MRSVPISASSPQERPEADPAPSWRGYGLALLPLALAGRLPGWGTLLLCLLFGLSVRFSGWAEARLLVGLLVAGVTVLPALAGAFSAQGGLAQIVLLSFHHLLILLLVGVLHLAATDLEGGSRRGLSLTLLAGLAAPQPGLLLALAGAALARQVRDDGHYPQRPLTGAERVQGQRFWGALGAGVLLLVALSATLPRYVLNVPTTPPGASRSTAPTPGQPAEQAALPSRPGTPPVVTVKRDPLPPTVPAPPLELLFVASAVFMLFLLVRLWSFGTRGSGVQKSWLDVLMVAGLILNLLLIFVLSQSAGNGSSGGGATASGSGTVQDAEQTVRVVQQPGLLNLLHGVGWAFLILQAVALLVAFWLLARWRLSGAPAQEADDPALSSQASRAAHAAPDHRVRLAYQQAGQALLEAGWIRGQAETPSRYAARLAQAQPFLAAPLHTLTRLYVPVRYGGVVSEAEATTAEAAAHELTRLAALYPCHVAAETEHEPPSPTGEPA